MLVRAYEAGVSVAENLVMLLFRVASRRELFMNQRPERNPRALQEAIEKFIQEKSISERMEEPGKNGPSLDSLISDRTPPERPR
jgi:hypothetical protein